MNRDPIDYDSPLGISKKEWTKVLGANLALLLLVYGVALVCTLCGSDLFLLNFQSDDLQRIEETLRGWGVYPVVEIAYSCIETVLIAGYSARKMPKWYLILSLIGIRIGANVLFTQTLGSYPSFVPFIINVLFVFAACLFRVKQDKWWKMLIRFAIATVLSLGLNELIALFRIKTGSLWHSEIGNVAAFALNVEYILVLALSFAFLNHIITFEKKGGVQPCPMNLTAGGFSPTTTKQSPKNSKTAKTNLSPKYRKRLRLLKAKVIAIQTTAMVVIAALPWFTGRPVEFALVYASFCLTRLMLGFNRSLHFKSELSCVTIGALCFWALTFLTPSVEVLIILSLCYGAGLALGFRLYWELHDLMMYHKAAKMDRYAMLYTVFKGNLNPKHINGVMRAKGYTDKDEIQIVQMYMQRDKVEYIGDQLNFAKITVEKKLTEIATRLYSIRG